MKSDVMNTYTKDGVTYLRYKIFDEFDFVNHAVSTRHGGVSQKEHLKSLNLGFKTADDPENVVENYRRFCDAANFDIQRLVFAKQTHSANVRLVTEDDIGKGIFRDRDYTDVDAHITDTPGIGLVIHTADCVPIAYVDPVHRAIGNAHCGWRGTYDNLAKRTLEAMNKHFGTRPEDVVCSIGPAICRDCYEVSEDLYIKFKKKFGFEDAVFEKNSRHYLDLMLINKHILENSGVKRIAISDLCTCCNTVDFYSHRGLGPERGLISSIIAMV